MRLAYNLRRIVLDRGNRGRVVVVGVLQVEGIVRTVRGAEIPGGVSVIQIVEVVGVVWV